MASFTANVSRSRRFSLALCGGLVLGLFLTALPTAGQARLGSLRSEGPATCSGARDLVLDGVEIVSREDAVTVGGSCNVVIRNSRLISDDAALRISGSADVTIVNSVLEGATVAISASGSSNVEYGDSEIYGGIQASSRADVRERGSNIVESSARVRASAPVQGGDDSVISIDASGVSVGNVRVDASGVSVGDDVAVRAGAGGATVVAGGVSLRTEGDYVRIDTPGETVSIDSNWRVANRGSYAAADTDRLLVELNAERSGDRVSLDLAGDVLFDFNSAAIRADAAAELAKVAHVIRQKAADEVVLVGHTDSIGKDDYNQRLSLERAAAVMNWLYEKEGIPPQLMAAKGMGSKQPVAHNTKPDGSDDPAGRAQNRRVEIEFSVQ